MIATVDSTEATLVRYRNSIYRTGSVATRFDALFSSRSTYNWRSRTVFWLYPWRPRCYLTPPWGLVPALSYRPRTLRRIHCATVPSATRALSRMIDVMVAAPASSLTAPGTLDSGLRESWMARADSSTPMETYFLARLETVNATMGSSFGLSTETNVRSKDGSSAAQHVLI